ncbi:early activation antigen CD69-like isoform X3 [Ambystoma mexicanum]|uniref:early activation antigen CD69-like isoform X3 n=1 Tax=Ambystoma mexicanum TaxID=8296 RepID=UPI0037E864F9
MAGAELDTGRRRSSSVGSRPRPDEGYDSTATTPAVSAFTLQGAGAPHASRSHADEYSDSDEEYITVVGKLPQIRPAAREDGALPETENLCPPEEERAPAACCRWWKNVRRLQTWVIISTLLLVAAVVTIGVLWHKGSEGVCMEDSRLVQNGEGKGMEKPSCSDGWLMDGQTCYFFSTERKYWNASQMFCTSHGATLAMLKDTQTLETINRLKGSEDYWLGLRKGEGQGWYWEDGTPFNNTIIPLRDDAANLNCAYLNSDKLGPLVCDSERHFICVKEWN